MGASVPCGGGCQAAWAAGDHALGTCAVADAPLSAAVEQAAAFAVGPSHTGTAQRAGPWTRATNVAAPGADAAAATQHTLQHLRGALSAGSWACACAR